MNSSLGVSDFAQELPGAHELEVVDLKGFLSLTAPEADTSLLDERLRDMGGKNNRWYDGALPPDFETISALSKVGAVNLLSEFLVDTRNQNW